MVMLFIVRPSDQTVRPRMGYLGDEFVADVANRRLDAESRLYLDSGCEVGHVVGRVNQELKGAVVTATQQAVLRGQQNADRFG